ncbi:MAG: hypothetical protein IAF58_15450 [Leptolyngbya sp.]|nr:hypothetical protein [Candidatus Melainabacteria bacterium]
MKKQSFVQNFGNASPEPSVAGTLSLIPGLGQFYNGERLKGWLFLEVGILNMALLGLLLCADSICNGILNLALHTMFIQTNRCFASWVHSNSAIRVPTFCWHCVLVLSLTLYVMPMIAPLI